MTLLSHNDRINIALFFKANREIDGGIVMVKHVILWQLKDELGEEEKSRVKADIKSGLEGLAGKIPGLVSIKVNITGLESSNADVMLDSLFDDEEALKAYAIHPEHVKVADNNVRPFTKTRVCMDYEED